MTPTEQDKMIDEELYQSITDICFESGGVTKPMADKLMQLITADRKRVALEARIESLQWALNDFNMPDTDTKANLQGFINDLKAQQEEV